MRFSGLVENEMAHGVELERVDLLGRSIGVGTLGKGADAHARQRPFLGIDHFKEHGLARGFDVGVGPRAILACPASDRCLALDSSRRRFSVTSEVASAPAPSP